MSRRERVWDGLVSALSPVHLEVLDESSMHNVPSGAESHFKIIVVADAFDGLGRVDRHRRVNTLLADELAAGLHALSVQAFTPEEWTRRGGQVLPSPPCLGGSTAD